MSTAAGLLAVVILVGLNGFFVATEFALVTVDRSRVERRASEGSAAARVVRSLLQHLSFHLSSAQFGITVSSLALGFVAEPTVSALLEEPLESLPGGQGSGLSLVLALTLATIFQMVLGELVPKSVAIAHPEPVARVVARPAKWFGVVFGPVVRSLNSAANWVVRRTGIEPVEELASVRSVEDLEMLIRSSGEHGGIDVDDVWRLTRSIRFGEKDAADVLVPRVDMTALSATASVADLVERSIDTGFSRFPVYGIDLDDVVGVVHVKEAHEVDRHDWPTRQIRTIMRDIRAVPESRELEDLLVDLRSSGSQLAVVVDEYGGTSGIVTLEDVLEEIVGEIDDEHDPWSPEYTPSRPAGVHDVDAALHADEVVDQCGFEMPEGEFETVAGFVLDLLGHIPVVGERVEHDGWILEVTKMDGLRIATVRLSEPRRPIRGSDGDQTSKSGGAS